MITESDHSGGRIGTTMMGFIFLLCVCGGKILNMWDKKPTAVKMERFMEL